MDNNEKKYIVGFNNGYLIARYHPDLFEKLEKNLDSKNEYLQGLLFGKREHEVEKNNLKLKSKLENKLHNHFLFFVSF